MKVQQLNADGYVLETFEYHNPWVEKIQFGDLDYDSDELVDITMTIRFDWPRIIPATIAKQESLVGSKEKAGLTASRGGRNNIKGA